MVGTASLTHHWLTIMLWYGFITVLCIIYITFATLPYRLCIGHIIVYCIPFTLWIEHILPDKLPSQELTNILLPAGKNLSPKVGYVSSLPWRAQRHPRKLTDWNLKIPPRKEKEKYLQKKQKNPQFCASKSEFFGKKSRYQCHTSHLVFCHLWAL